MSFRFTLAPLALLAVVIPLQSVLALTNNLALTPPMGWNSWNNFGCGVNESIIVNVANAMATNGMAAAGYRFINIDDCWQIARDQDGVIVADPSKFPHGIRWLADYVHSKGLKLGLYSDHGLLTCQKRPGGYGYEYLDAATYASWDVDYLKYDNCNLPPGDIPAADYYRMSDGLMKSGWPITFSICAWSFKSWDPTLGNLWRTTGDINDHYSSMVSKLGPNSRTAFLAGPGRWNDPDMLEVGRGDFTDVTQARSHFGLWCIMAAPLLAGNDVTHMSARTLAILTNPEAIAVDQDPAGEQGIEVASQSVSNGDLEVWSKPLGYDFTTRAVALFNNSSSNTDITCQWTDLGLQPGAATVRDLWTHTDLGTFTNSFTTSVPAHGTAMLKVVGKAPALPGLGLDYLSDLQPVYAYVGWGTMTKDRSIGGNSIRLGGVSYPKGLGVHAFSGVEYNLGGICSRFQADIGVDDEVGNHGSVIFEVFADGTKIFDSSVQAGGMAPQSIDLDVTGVRRLTLGVEDADDGNSYDHADWAGARVIVTNTVPQTPSTPTGLSARAGTAIALTWDATRSANHYLVKRATKSAGPYMVITNVPIANYLDASVTNGVRYYYRVAAVSSLDTSADSPEVSAVPCSPPAVPDGVMTTTTSSNATVTWSAAPDASTYTVARFSSDTPAMNVASGLIATRFTDTNVSAGATYYYRVSAVNPCSQSAFSAFVAAIVVPVVPKGLSASAGNRQAILTWSASPGASAYNVKRSTSDGGPYALVASDVPATNYWDTTVANGTTYYYVVSAVNPGGESPDSPQVSVTPTVPLTAYWDNRLTGAAQNWNLDANWTNAPHYPNAAGEAAVINADISAPQTINLNQAITLGSLSLGDANGSGPYTLAATGGSLTFSAVGGSLLTELSSSAGDILATHVFLMTNLLVVNDSPNPLILAGPLSGNGNSALMLERGALQIGNGTVNGSLDAVNVTNDGVLVFNRSDSVTMSGVISGSGAVMQCGAGVLTLSGANTFSGDVTISGGTVQVANGSALGSTSGSTVITNGGTLDVNGYNLSGERVTVSGSGVGGGGAIVSSGGQQTHALRSVTLAGNTTFGGAGPWNPSNNQNRWDIRAASDSSTNGCSLSTGGHPYRLIKTGGNQISLVAVDVDPALGDIDIQQGLMGWETATSSMGNPASNIIVRAGATLSFYNAQTAWNKHFILYGNGVSTNMYNWSGANVVVGPMQLNGACVFAGGGTSLSLDNTVTGPGSLIKEGGYTVNLAATDTYTGDTLVKAGTLGLIGNGSIRGSLRITVAAGATLDASLRNDATLTLSNGQTLDGDGTVRGNVIVGSGATLAPGDSIGTLKFNNNLTLGGGSRTMVEVGQLPETNDAAQVVGGLTYGGTLMVTNISGKKFAVGDSFKLFNAESFRGAFANIVPAIPAVGLAWDTNDLVNGVLRIISRPTPSPQVGAVSLSGDQLVFSGSNGVPGWTYYVLTTTNLALPLSEWTSVATNDFGAGGTFSNTNTMNQTVKQEFYRLQLK